MNCRPGDLAVVIAAVNQANIGPIVKVLRPYEAAWRHAMSRNSNPGDRAERSPTKGDQLGFSNHLHRQLQCAE